MTKLFSLRKKILLILIITPTIPLIIFLIVALREFINDKQAYILDSNLTQSTAAATSIKSRIDLLIANSNELLGGDTKDAAIEKFTVDLGIKSASIINFTDNTFRNWGEIKHKKFKLADDNELDSIWKDPDTLRENFSKLPNYGLSITASGKNLIFSFQEARDLGKSEPRMKKNGKFEVLVLIADKNKILPNIFSKSSNLLYFVDARGAVLAGSDDAKSVADMISYIRENYFEKVMPYGSTKVSNTSSDYNLAAFSTVGVGDLYYLQLTSWRLAYSAALKLITKTSLLFVAIISFIIMLSLYLSNQLTRTLTELTKASEKISKRDFDLKIGKKSNDELGILATSFEKMAEEISDLLRKIEDHNRFLEKKVQERTAELFELNQLQKALMDSLEEGFMVVDADGKLHEVYSKASEELFKDVGMGQDFVEMISTGPEQYKEISEWYKLLISEAMPFSEMADIGIKEFVNHNGRYIHIEYYAIRNGTGGINFVVVVAKDITEERNNLIEIRKKQQQIELATKIIKNRLQVYELVKFIKQSIADIRKQVDTNKINLTNVFLNVHTIKGNCLAFNFFTVADIAHKFEQELSQKEIATQDQKEKIVQIVNELSDALDKLIQENILFLGKNIINGVLTYEMPITQLVSFFEQLSSYFEGGKSSKDFKKLKEQVLSRPVIDYVGYLEDVVTDTAGRQAKKVKVEFVGAETKWIGHNFFNFFGALVHPIKNSIVHGIEYPNERVAKGKPEEGVIKLSTKKNADTLEIIIEDDGAGVSIEMARKKLVETGKAGNVDKMSDVEILNAFMKAGVSGLSNVSIDAGRGVGSQSLAHEIDLIKGSMQWETKKDKGTKLTIKLPSLEETV